MRKLKKYKPTKFRAKGSYYDEESADFAVAFIESLCHTKGTWAGKKFELIDWQEQIIRDLFGTLKPNGKVSALLVIVTALSPKFCRLVLFQLSQNLTSSRHKKRHHICDAFCALMFSLKNLSLSKY